MVVGSSPPSQLELPGVGGLSPLHARIVCQAQGYVIEDMQSQYGTLRNGCPVQAEYMLPGQEYVLGAACIMLDPESVVTVPQQPATEEASGQPQVKKVRVMKTASAGQASAAAGSGGLKVGGVELNKLAKKYNRNASERRSRLTVVYVVLLLLIAFYAGIALRHWERTGNYLPGILSDGESTRL